MRILVAEDEPYIADSYRMVLELHGHNVTLTKDGQECTDKYVAQLNNDTAYHPTSGLDLNDRRGSSGEQSVNLIGEDQDPFDVVILDYRMPKKDGLAVAKQILQLRPNQRIIFASAYVRETLLDSVKELNMVVELLQKPFDLDVLVNTVEDKSLYEDLEKLNVDIKKFKSWNPTHLQIKDLLAGLLRLRDPQVDFRTILTGSESSQDVPNSLNPS